MVDRRRILGPFAVLSLVFLRLVIGWHFFREGAQKLEYDHRDGTFNLAFSADGFFRQAKGPLAHLYHEQAPDDHGWRELLATPRKNTPPTLEQLDERARWASDYQKRRDEADKKKTLRPIEFPPFAAYADWANRIATDWRNTLQGVKTTDSSFTADQKKQADASLQTHLEDLAEYLAGEADAIAEYRHELWRLQSWQKEPEAADLPFYKERIAVKTGETAGKPGAWVKQVKAIESAYHGDLTALRTKEQQGSVLTTAAFDKALVDPRQSRLDFDNILVTALTLGVGICLLLGLFTRLAALAGALFLAAVIASQPFWLADSVPTINNWIELPALLVLAATGAGRWLGLDYFTYAFFNRFRRRDNLRA